MEQTRRSFFAAIGAAILGKYAVRFFPQAVTHIDIDYIAKCERMLSASPLAAQIFGSPENAEFLMREYGLLTKPARLPA